MKKTTTMTHEPRPADGGHSLVKMTRETDGGFPVRTTGTCECGKKISNKGGYTAEASVLRRHEKHRDEASKSTP